MEIGVCSDCGVENVPIQGPSLCYNCMWGGYPDYEDLRRIENDVIKMTVLQQQLENEKD